MWYAICTWIGFAVGVLISTLYDRVNKLEFEEPKTSNWRNPFSIHPLIEHFTAKEKFKENEIIVFKINGNSKVYRIFHIKKLSDSNMYRYYISRDG